MCLCVGAGGGSYIRAVSSFKKMALYSEIFGKEMGGGADDRNDMVIYSYFSNIISQV